MILRTVMMIKVAQRYDTVTASSLRAKIINVSSIFFAIFAVFFVNSKLAVANSYTEKALNEQYSTKSSDLLVHQEDNAMSSRDRLEFLKKLSFLADSSSIEIGEYSCYSGNSFSSIYLNDLPAQTRTLTLSLHTRTQTRSVKLEENSETVLSKSSKNYCHEIINISHKLNYVSKKLALEIKKLEANIHTQEPISPPELELNIQSSWKKF